MSNKRAKADKSRPKVNSFVKNEESFLSDKSAKSQPKVRKLSKVDFALQESIKVLEASDDAMSVRGVHYVLVANNLIENTGRAIEKALEDAVKLKELLSPRRGVYQKPDSAFPAQPIGNAGNAESTQPIDGVEDSGDLWELGENDDCGDFSHPHPDDFD